MPQNNLEQNLGRPLKKIFRGNAIIWVNKNAKSKITAALFEPQAAIFIARLSLNI